jgi:hypothetical protein
MSLLLFKNMTEDFATIVEAKPWKFDFTQVTVDTKNGYRMTLLVDETLEAVDHVYALAEIGIYAPNFKRISDTEYVEILTKEDIAERLKIREEIRKEKICAV